MRARMHEGRGWETTSPIWDATNWQANMQYLQRRPGFQISPYHENPVDFDKYDEEVNTTETTDKSNVSAGSGSKGHGKCEASTKKTKVPRKLPSRPLTTACAANFEKFGQK